MCGRFFLARRALEIARALGLPLSPGANSWGPRYNIAPTQDVLTVVAGPEGILIEPGGGASSRTGRRTRRSATA
jgi:putative SOS response-associated peptidase YedK